MRLAERLARDAARLTAGQGQRLLLRRPLAETPAEPNALWGALPWGQFPWDGRQPFTDLICWGFPSGGLAMQLHGGVWQMQRTIRISDAEITAQRWPGPPRRDDWVILADGSQHSVLGCDTRGLQGIAAVHILTVLGGA